MIVHSTYEVPDGPNDEPAVSVAELVARTPRTVDVTVTFRAGTTRLTYPAYVSKWAGRHLGDPTPDETDT